MDPWNGQLARYDPGCIGKRASPSGPGRRCAAGRAGLYAELRPRRSQTSTIRSERHHHTTCQARSDIHTPNGRSAYVRYSAATKIWVIQGPNFPGSSSNTAFTLARAPLAVCDQRAKKPLMLVRLSAVPSGRKSVTSSSEPSFVDPAQGSRTRTANAQQCTTNHESRQHRLVHDLTPPAPHTISRVRKDLHHTSDDPSEKSAKVSKSSATTDHSEPHTGTVGHPPARH